MRRLLLISILSVANVAFADAIGVRASGGVWSYEASGQIRDSADVNEYLDLKADLGIKDEEKFNGFIYVEHPVPVLPNVRLGVTDLKLAGNGTTTRTVDWNGTNIPSGTTVNSSVDLSHSEIGLYYEIWDTGFDFDLGLNFKFFDGNVNINDGALINATSSFDETIPMGYVSVGIPLLAGFKIGGDLSYISYDGDKFQDLLVNVRWVSDFLLGVELGYRSFTIDYLDGNEFADVKVDGPYLNLRLDF